MEMDRESPLLQPALQVRESKSSRESAHAIADAILGAAGLNDIGHYFPNTDETLRGISSLEILRRVVAIITEGGGRIINIDSTLIAEEPPIGPHVSQMRENIGTALGLPALRIGIKATTNECLGFLGRGEGIAAMATAMVETPEE